MAEITTLDGYTVLLDEEALDRVQGYRWRTAVGYVREDGSVVRYAYRSTHRGNILMHRMILDAPRGKQVLHLNRSGLDNRKSNLFIGAAPSCPLLGHVSDQSRKRHRDQRGS